MNGELGKRLRLLASVVSVLVLLAIGAFVWFRIELNGSRPQLDGTARVAGLGAPVTVTRDVLGVPTVRGANRADVARALGFLHAQDRFFQMDTLRRRPAGELAEVFGKAALPSDRLTRPHRFRDLARQVLDRLPADQRGLLEAYTAGVNAGLGALNDPPFEYVLMRTKPAPWRPEDSVLVVYAMTLELQDATNNYERSLTTLRDTLGNTALAFFAPLTTPEDAALDGSAGTAAPVPGPGILNLRTVTSGAGRPGEPLAAIAPAEAVWPGSNSFAVTGAHTAGHGALLANDPHLHLGIPNIWYRAVLEWTGAGDTGSSRLVGVTIPGLPFVVLGSNGHVAWGMTDAYADTADFVPVSVRPDFPDLYRVPGRDDLQNVEVRRDVIQVKGASPVTVESRWTIWGPLLGTDAQDRPLALHWVAHDPAATNLDFIGLESARTVPEAIAVAHRAGIPAQNFLVADRDGRVGWTIIGKYPRRVGFDGRLTVSWMYGDRRWDGLVAPDDVPTLIIPATGGRSAPLAPAAADGRLWTANNRVVGGQALAQLGDAGYAVPARAAQIRDDLAKLSGTVRPADLLAIQLDDRAVFLDRWHALLLKTLSPAAVANSTRRAKMRELVGHWEGRAAVESVSYRLVREFRLRTAELVFNPIFERCVDVDPEFDWHRFNYEPALWTLLQQRPEHLLAARFLTWDDLLVRAADDVLAGLDREGVALAHATWGQANRARIRHPIGNVLPAFLAGWLNLPPDPLPGDVNMPRVQSPSFGASMRLVVSPGREEEGLFEMPAGQSGHPLSPYYRAGHEAWVQGRPSPLLPGPAVHTLQLTP